MEIDEIIEVLNYLEKCIAEHKIGHMVFSHRLRILGEFVEYDYKIHPEKIINEYLVLCNGGGDYLKIAEKRIDTIIFLEKLLSDIKTKVIEKLISIIQK